MLAIIPAAGRGSRIQPLAFSKELLPLGSRAVNGTEQPRAISEHLLDRMALAGAKRFCFVVAPGKTDILQYYGDVYCGIPIFYLIQPLAHGLCDAVFRASIHVKTNEHVLIGLPDTLWFPEIGLAKLPETPLSLLLFPVLQPELFDAVSLGPDNRVLTIAVKDSNATTEWIWGAMRLRGDVFKALDHFWRAREKRDEYLGTLINAWIAHGGEVYGYRLGTSYSDVGTLNGWRGALRAMNQGASVQHSLEVSS